MVHFGDSFRHTVLLDTSLWIEQKFIENGKIEKFKWDILRHFQTMWHRSILPVLKTLCTEKRTRNSPLGNYCTNEMEVQKGQEQIVKLFFEGFYCCRPSVLLINSSSNAANLSLYVDCNLESSTLLAIIMKRPLAKFWIFRIITLLHC